MSQAEDRFYSPESAPPAAAGLTRQLAVHASEMRWESLPANVLSVAKHCLLDWVGVTIAASAEPLVTILEARARAEGGSPRASLLSSGLRTSLGQAALVNGSAGHALDYDDVLLPVNGHPTVPVAPAVLALGESLGASGKDVLSAFVAGVETESRVGALMGEAHYAQGWHATGTVGTFGAAAGAGRLLGLDPERLAHALGIAGTQAAGLKAVFGTMCKPLHAGKAAQNGLLAAELARDGFTSHPQILDCEQGFAATQTREPSAERAIEGLGAVFHTPDTLFKYHAACYGTHPPIDAARRIGEQLGGPGGRGLESIRSVEIRVAPRCLAVCDIETPRTGLEMKFSLRMTVAMGLAGVDTACLDSYSEALAGRADLGSLCERTVVVGDPGIARNTAEVSVRLADGAMLREPVDLSRPVRDLDAQGSRLAAKFRSLVEPYRGESRTEAMVARLLRLEEEDDVASLLVEIART